MITSEDIEHLGKLPGYTIAIEANGQLYDCDEVNVLLSSRTIVFVTYLPVEGIEKDEHDEE